ncbi:MAG: hypothetical protein RL318_177 [Fibrobacterota bacterium]|jgi:hypothetical protein
MRLQSYFLPFLCLVASAWSGSSQPLVVVVPPAAAAVAPGDTAKVSFTTIHSAGRNWLQTQIAPVGACQEIVVDSIRASDTVRVDSLGRKEDYFDGIHRAAHVWWHLQEIVPSHNCGSVKASRRLDSVAHPRKHPRTDTLLTRWILDKVVAHGPSGRLDTATANLVDQAGEKLCPTVSIWCPGPFNMDDSTRPVPDYLDSLKRRIAMGLPVVVVGPMGDNKAVEIKGNVLDTNLVHGLGIPSFWATGNEVSTFRHDFKPLRAWGTELPKSLSKFSARKVYQWRNTRPACCQNCDTVCGEWPANEISTSGLDLTLSNATTERCEQFEWVDQDLAPALEGNQWLLLPDTSEIRTGRLWSTFNGQFCGGRRNAIQVVNDTVRWNGAELSLLALEQALGVAAKRQAPKVVISATSSGLRVIADPASSGLAQVLVRSVSGRVLTQSPMTTAELNVPLSGHGIFLVEVRGRQGVTHLRLAR